jgi:hypothetical protein
MDLPAPFLRYPVTADDEISVVEALAHPDNVRPVSEGARESPARAAVPAASMHEVCEAKCKSRQACIKSASGSSAPGILAPNADTRGVESEATEAATCPKHDPCLLEDVREIFCRNQKASRERLRVRCCPLTLRPM